MPELTRHERISLALHQAVKEKLLADPEHVILKAKSNLARWKDSYDDQPRWMIEWEVILEKELDKIVVVLDGLDEHSVLLRSSSPFTGIISNEQRIHILNQFKTANGCGFKR